jgi:hypothetical protein
VNVASDEKEPLDGGPAAWHGRRVSAIGCQDAPVNQTADAEADFTKDDDDHVQSSARVLGSENEASTAIQRLQDDKVLGCYRDQIEKRVKSIDEVKSGELKVKDVKLGQLSSDRYGDESAAAQIVASLEATAFRLTCTRMWSSSGRDGCCCSTASSRRIRPSTPTLRGGLCARRPAAWSPSPRGRLG